MMTSLSFGPHRETARLFALQSMVKLLTKAGK